MTSTQMLGPVPSPWDAHLAYSTIASYWWLISQNVLPFQPPGKKNYDLYLEHHFGKYCCYCVFFCAASPDVGYEVKELARIKTLSLVTEGFLLYARWCCQK